MTTRLVEILLLHAKFLVTRNVGMREIPKNSNDDNMQMLRAIECEESRVSLPKCVSVCLAVIGREVWPSPPPPPSHTQTHTHTNVHDERKPRSRSSSSGEAMTDRPGPQNIPTKCFARGHDFFIFYHLAFLFFFLRNILIFFGVWKNWKSHAIEKEIISKNQKRLNLFEEKKKYFAFSFFEFLENFFNIHLVKKPAGWIGRDD